MTEYSEYNGNDKGLVTQLQELLYKGVMRFSAPPWRAGVVVREKAVSTRLLIEPQELYEFDMENRYLCK